MQRYDFFPFLQNFSWEKLKICYYFNTCLQNEGGFVGVHIIIYIICGCPGNAWQGQKPCLRIGGTMPYPASLRNFYTCTRRHRGEMSLTEMCGKAHRGRNRRLGSATMADFLGSPLRIGEDCLRMPGTGILLLSVGSGAKSRSWNGCFADGRQSDALMYVNVF